MTLEILLLPPCHFPPSMQSRGVRRARNAKVQLVRKLYRISPFLLKLMSPRSRNVAHRQDGALFSFRWHATQLVPSCLFLDQKPC